MASLDAGWPWAVPATNTKNAATAALIDPLICSVCPYRPYQLILFARRHILKWDIRKRVLERVMPASVFTAAYGEFLAALRQAREEAGMRQIDLAARIGKPQSFISKAEKGERRLDVVELIAVLRALGISPSDFIDRLDGLMPRDLQI